VARPGERLGEPRTDGARESGAVAERFRRPPLTRLGRSEARLLCGVGLKGAAVWAA